MKILVTGGAGFIGSHFVELLLKNNAVEKLVVLDAMTYAASKRNLEIADPRFSFVLGDICDSSLVDKLLTQSSHVLNFAAESHVDRSIVDSVEFIRTNIVGTQTLLASAVKHEIEKFVQISTDEVYGSIAEDSWNEESPLLPNSPYSASKASADLLVRSFHNTYGLNTSITRCSNNYGPRQFPEKVIPLFIKRASLGESLPVYGTGRNIRDWLHVNDHCRGIELVLKSGLPGEIYNIGGGIELDNLELASEILSVMGNTRSKIEFVEDRKGHDLRYSVDWRKIQDQLGYAPMYDFKQGLKETVEWYQKNPEWWIGK